MIKKTMSLTDTKTHHDLVHSKLFTLFQLTPQLNLQHRIVMAPLSRHRSHNLTPDTKAVAQYYGDRSKNPGTLIITESIYIALEYTGLIKDAPGIFNDEQFNSWKSIFNQIHLNRSMVFAQLWAPGRQADPEVLLEMGLRYYGVSPVYENTHKKEIAKKIGNHLIELTVDQIHKFKKLFLKLSRRILHAGADGIEIHACSGSLLHQFINSVTNRRRDKYGGSIENRARFILELVDYLCTEIDPSRIGIRLSPFTKVFDLTKTDGILHDTISQHAYILEKLEARAQRGQKLAYVHIVEPANENLVSNEFVLSIWKGPLIRCGHYLPQNVEKLIRDVERDANTLLGFGRYFISNPDLVYKLKKNVELTEPKEENFTFGGDVGYNDYPRMDGL